jgi:hypothetical protein
MPRNFVHITREGDRWAVEHEGRRSPDSTHRTQAAAIKAGRRMAKREQTEWVVHGRAGRIRDRVSCGTDPRRSKG